MTDERKRPRHLISKPMLHSTSGEEQHIYDLFTQLVAEIQARPKRWHVLIDPLMELKGQAVQISKLLDKE